ncbi:MAG: hypothetical protein K0S14_955, partial [Thermomicrobiales bacterium]|nr:hypothetical protein [Thermomicrobiales bacterium]
MGVAVNGDKAASPVRGPGVGRVQVEARGIGVDFQGGSGLRGDSKNAVPVEISTLAAFDQPP